MEDQDGVQTYFELHMTRWGALASENRGHGFVEEIAVGYLQVDLEKAQDQNAEEPVARPHYQDAEEPGLQGLTIRYPFLE